MTKTLIMILDTVWPRSHSRLPQEVEQVWTDDHTMLFKRVAHLWSDARSVTTKTKSQQDIVVWESDTILLAVTFVCYDKCFSTILAIDAIHSMV